MKPWEQDLLSKIILVSQIGPTRSERACGDFMGKTDEKTSLKLQRYKILGRKNRENLDARLDRHCGLLRVERSLYHLQARLSGALLGDGELVA